MAIVEVAVQVIVTVLITLKPDGTLNVKNYEKCGYEKHCNCCYNVITQPNTELKLN